MLRGSESQPGRPFQRPGLFSDDPRWVIEIQVAYLGTGLVLRASCFNRRTWVRSLLESRFFFVLITLLVLSAMEKLLLSLLYYGYLERRVYRSDDVQLGHLAEMETHNCQGDCQGEQPRAVEQCPEKEPPIVHPLDAADA